MFVTWRLQVCTSPIPGHDWLLTSDVINPSGAQRKHTQVPSEDNFINHSNSRYYNLGFIMEVFFIISISIFFIKLICEVCGEGFKILS